MVENKYLVNNKISSQYFVIYPFVGNDRGQTVFCKSSQGFHTLLLVFWPIPPCRSPLEQWCFGTFNSLQRCSMGLRSGGLARPLQDLEMLLTKPLLRCPARCVWDHCHAERPSHVSSSMPLLMEGGFHSKSHSFLYTDQSVLVPLQKTAPKHDVSTPMLHSRYGVLSPPNTTSWVFTKKLYFGFKLKNYFQTISDFFAPLYIYVAKRGCFESLIQEIHSKTLIHPLMKQGNIQRVIESLHEI